MDFHGKHTCLCPLLQAVLSPDVIDLEAPEYSARAVLLLLFLGRDGRCSRCFHAAVPVHARYQRPAEGAEEALVVLQSPEVLLCCCHGEILIAVLGLWLCLSSSWWLNEHKQQAWPRLKTLLFFSLSAAAWPKAGDCQRLLCPCVPVLLGLFQLEDVALVTIRVCPDPSRACFAKAPLL